MSKTYPNTIQTLTGLTASTVNLIKFQRSTLPNLEKHATVNRIKEVLGSCTTFAFTLGGVKYYQNGELKDGGEGVVVSVNEDGTLTLDAEKLSVCVGKCDLTDTTPENVAVALGMGVAIYDHKLVLFYEGEQPLHTYEDLYTYEAMHLYMTDADQIEIVNAFIDLPDRISNDANNTIYYTAPDLNLGIQTSIYYAQMGQSNGLKTAPALVVGEGKHTENFTTVRVFNHQNTCTTQFLAFDATVKGGVQVAAAQVGEDVLIATAPFAKYDGKDGDVRVFDTYGMIRMVINVKDEIPGPYTIVTGQFAEGVTDEVLLVTSQTTNDKGELTYAIISLEDGKLITKQTLDCSFAKATSTVTLSVRRNVEGMDTVILYFSAIQTVYEGNAQTAKFDKADITLPADATGVSASTVNGQKYVVTLPERGGNENQSFVNVYDGTTPEGVLQDVGFRENRFFVGLMQDIYNAEIGLDYNEDRYVSKGPFCHLRTDQHNTAMKKLGEFETNEQVIAFLDSAKYADYACTFLPRFADRLSAEYLFLEPCFTHRFDACLETKNFTGCVDPYTGTQMHVSVGKSNEYINYEECGHTYYNGTYADGLLKMAKMRMYPLRSFLRATAAAFRGDGANPEHLVGVSPVHEHEICVSKSIGDYNVYMVEGFRRYLLKRYQSLENINKTFGTPFEDIAAIDPPRDNGRGEWDAYKGDYYVEWTQYSRFVISKRIMEAYREALVAGYPPESITAHQIPEGEAVSGFLGDADTRLSPIDVVLTCGTGYGGTRYGLVNPKNNFAYNAHLMGHSNISIGEYNAMATENEPAYRQLKMYWENGVRMIHHMTGTPSYRATGLYAIKKMMDENLPRPGYTGGTTNAMSFTNGNKQYNIVQIGAGAEGASVGLLKSVDAQGKWEGTVYVVPFHTKVVATAIDALNDPVARTQNVFSTGILGTIKNSDQVEITFNAAKIGGSRAWVTIEAYHGGCLLEASATTYELTETMIPYRYVLSNQLYDSKLEIKVTFHTEADDGSMDAIKLEHLCGTLQTECVGLAYYDGKVANAKNKAHVGGVTFDLLNRA